MRTMGANGVGRFSVEWKSRTMWISLRLKAIVLEALELLADCKEQCLVPRDPSGPLYEIE
jgi:hypothetical protein